MSTPSSRRHAQEPLTPITPTRIFSSHASTGSPSVKPRSEYLRNALDAKRARQSNLTPPPSETKRPEPKSDPQRESDPWMDQARGEVEAPKSTPTRRIRPSDGPPRMLSQREQHVETDKMKELLFSLNLKLELIRNQNNELKDQMDEANRRIEELEHLEDENHDLRAHNNHLELKMQDMSDEIVELRERNSEILQIQDESVSNMEMQNSALEEAAEIIIDMEQDKDALAAENEILKEQVSKLQSAPTVETCHSDLDGHGKLPLRIYSVDESRPSTSHFDSDYYSQPNSPHYKASRESLPQLSFSDRARHLLSMNKESKKSTQDLKKRFSDASVKSVRPSSVIPEVPKIPEALRVKPSIQIPAMHEERKETPVPEPLSSARTPRRIPSPRLPSALVRSNSRSTPRTPTDGLRGMFHNSMTLSSSTSSSRPSTSYAKSPLESIMFKKSHNSDRTPTPDRSKDAHAYVPFRHSSRKANTSTSLERLQYDQQPPPPQYQSRPTTSSGDKPPDLDAIDAQTDVSAEWDNYSPPESVLSELNTEPGADYRERWFRTVDKLGVPKTSSVFVRSSVVAAAAAQAAQALGTRGGREVHPTLQAQPEHTLRHPSRRSSMVGPGLSSGGAIAGVEMNFLFNPMEDADEFLERVSGARRGRESGEKK